MANKRVGPSNNSNIHLVSQVGNLCPHCGHSLLYEKNKKKYKGYEIAHIYPLNPTKEELRILKGVPKLSPNIDSDDNLIPLCGGCHIKFDRPRTRDEYMKLYQLKKELNMVSAQKELWSQYNLEHDILSIIDSISTQTQAVKVKLSFRPLKVKQKLNKTMHPLSKITITMNVSLYYPLIKEKLAQIDKEYSGRSDLIAGQIKLFYLLQKGQSKNQQEIFDNIVRWLDAKGGNALPEASSIIASFYIQNCEIFE